MSKARGNVWQWLYCELDATVDVQTLDTIKHGVPRNFLLLFNGNVNAPRTQAPLGGVQLATSSWDGQTAIVAIGQTAHSHELRGALPTSQPLFGSPTEFKKKTRLARNSVIAPRPSSRRVPSDGMRHVHRGATSAPTAACSRSTHGCYRSSGGSSYSTSLRRIGDRKTYYPVRGWV